MAINTKTIAIENTRFIFNTNFSGDPERDSYGDIRRKANIIIPDPEQAKDLIKAGFRVRETRPRKDEDPEEFTPEYCIPVILKYRDRTGALVKYPPKVYLVVDDNEPVLLDEDTVGKLDSIRARNVNVILNPYEYDPANNGVNLYIRTMYVEQELDDDPYAARYRRRKAEQRNDEEEPF